MLTVGMYIADRYEIVGKVGAGGMSDVYKAFDHILGRNVAIKVLKAEFSEDRSFVSKFRTEAQSAAGLEHANIVNIYDVGSEDGMYYIVMEYVEGITLKTYIEKKGQLSFKESVSIAIQVARGIEAAHNKNIIHRDIKPQNIIISTEGKVKVTDFGIARAASANTISADVMGSVHYASPEQARNGFVDGRSDIYSLGIVMFEMITGRVPFDGDTTVAVAIQHLQEEMAMPSQYAPNIPISFEKIIMKSTQKNPDRRYQAISELLADLRRSLTNPNEDFVVIAPLTDNAKTKVISGEEVRQIQNNRGITPDIEPVMPNQHNVEADLEEEDEDEEALLSPKMDKAVTISLIAIASLFVIAIICVLGNMLGLFGGSSKSKESQTESSYSTESESESTQDTQEGNVTMIKLVGMTQEEAQKWLDEKGLKVQVEIVESDAADGTVVEQNVDEGSEVAVGSTVIIKVAGKPEGTIEVPSVVGETEQEAIRLIEAANLKWDRDYEPSDTVPSGTVISQNPESGEVAEGTTITIVVSQGLPSVVVPDLENLSEKKARAALEKAGLKLGSVTTEYSDSIKEGRVISQSVNAGKTVEKGTKVNIVISLGKKVEYYQFTNQYSFAGATKATYTLKLSDGSKRTKTVNVVGGRITVSEYDLTSSSGTLVIVWTYTDDEGNEATETEEIGLVKFTKQ